MNKSYCYVNDIGEPKELVVEFPPKNGEYSVILWSRRTGDLCGSGKMTYQRLKEYLEHYGVQIDF